MVKQQLNKSEIKALAGIVVMYMQHDHSVHSKMMSTIGLKLYQRLLNAYAKATHVKRVIRFNVYETYYLQQLIAAVEIHDVYQYAVAVSIYNEICKNEKL